MSYAAPSPNIELAAWKSGGLKKAVHMHCLFRTANAVRTAARTGIGSCEIAARSDDCRETDQLVRLRSSIRPLTLSRNVGSEAIACTI